MSLAKISYRIQLQSFFILITAFPLASSSVIAQSENQKDTVIKVAGGSLLKIDETKLFIKNDTVIKLPSTAINALSTHNEKTIAFYSSLKSKAEKSKITKALYDLVIVAPDTSETKIINRKSDENFLDYSGLKIRNINIKQIDVFGGNIYNPAAFEPNRLEKFLNSTHFNTREQILRKYLLFNEGDTISPLSLTDNERIIRQLPFIDDARIIVVPVSESDADILVVTKDVYSLGGDFSYHGISKGSVWVYDKNIFGMGHEFEIEIPYSSTSKDSPGIGLNYNINNIRKSFINLNLNYYNGLGKKSFGFSLHRPLLSSETKYAYGITINNTSTTEDLDTMPVPEPLKYNFQDYWLQRSFMIDRRSVSRIIAGLRYINNNVYRKPEILPDSYYELQKYRLYLGSLSFSMQKFYKTNLLYSYGRTEDIPYGALLNITSGIEQNEFKKRVYLGTDASFGFSSSDLGYFHISGGVGTFLNSGKTEQGVLTTDIKYFSNLITSGRFKIRNFITISYIKGFDRYHDEYIKPLKENAFSSFSNDSLKGLERFKLSIETVLFHPLNFYGFRFAFFGFAEAVNISGIDTFAGTNAFLSSIGVGLRIRNDNLVFKTFQLRLGYYPSLPNYSEADNLIISGEQLLRPRTFDPSPPYIARFR